MTKAVAKRADEQTVVAQPETGTVIHVLERLARDPSVDPARIQQLLQLKRDEEDRDARREFLDALASMQAVLPAVERKGTGHNDKKYARFEDFIAAIKPKLAEHGFSLTFRLKQEPTSVQVTGVLGHRSGHQEETSLTLPVDNTGNKNPVQALGSSTSYGKRYVGLTLLGIATEDEDDDGKKAGGPKTITEEQAKELGVRIQKTKAPAATIQIIFEHFKVDNLADLTPAQHDKISAQLTDKYGV